MRIVRFRDQAGYARTGEWEDGQIRSGHDIYSEDDVIILPPTEPSKILCVGANYVEHIREGGWKVPEELPDRPLLFYKGPNTLAGHGDTITLPTPGITEECLKDSGQIKKGEGRIDFEAELGVVIDRQCKNVSEDEALGYVRGYTCVNDVSNRDDQEVEDNWIRGKAFDNAAPIGPVLATPEHVPEDPRIQLWQNGEKKQDSKDDELLFSVEEVIAEITKFITLEPGDVIAMGTTYGVGPMKDGDTIEIEVEGVGTLEHAVQSPD